MTTITVNPNCGNAPKKEFLKNLNIAFTERNLDFLINSVTDAIVWDKIGDTKIEGIDKFSKELEKTRSEKISELILNQILTHGKEGAVNGIVKMENGKIYAFSDFYKFSSAKGNKVKLITTYCIKI